MKRPALWLIAVIAGACEPSSSYLGTRFFKKVPVIAADGARVSLGADDHPAFAGASLDIPGDSLRADTVLTFEEGLDALSGEPAASSVLWVGPEVALDPPATLTLPFTTTPADQPPDLEVLGLIDGGTVRWSSTALEVDVPRARITFLTRRLGRFQVVRRTCTQDSDCGINVCLGGRCRGQPCGSTSCAIDERCCSPSCGTCAAAGNACVARTCGACSAANPCGAPEVCIDGRCVEPAPVPCGEVMCRAGQRCCSAACGLCVGPAEVCPAISCRLRCTPGSAANAAGTCPAGLTCVGGYCEAAVPCGTALCTAGQVCCNASCNRCVPQGTACDQRSCLCAASECGPMPASPSCTCRDGTLGCNTGRCVRAASNTTCAWEMRTCP